MINNLSTNILVLIVVLLLVIIFLFISFRRPLFIILVGSVRAYKSHLTFSPVTHLQIEQAGCFTVDFYEGVGKLKKLYAMPAMSYIYAFYVNNNGFGNLIDQLNYASKHEITGVSLRKLHEIYRSSNQDETFDSLKRCATRYCHTVEKMYDWGEVGLVCCYRLTFPDLLYHTFNEEELYTRLKQIIEDMDITVDTEIKRGDPWEKYELRSALEDQLHVQIHKLSIAKKVY